MPLELRAQASQAVASSIQVCCALSCDAMIVHSVTTDHMADMCTLLNIGFRGRYFYTCRLHSISDSAARDCLTDLDICPHEGLSS